MKKRIVSTLLVGVFCFGFLSSGALLEAVVAAVSGSSGSGQVTTMGPAHPKAFFD